MSRLTPTIDGRGVASIARNLIYLLGGRGIYFATRFIYVVILARVLGPQIYGMITYGMAWYLLFLPLTRMGLEVVLSREAGKNRQDGDRTARLTLTLRIASILVVTAAYVILSIIMEDDPASRSIVLILSFALAGRSLALWTENVYTAFEVNQYTFRQQAIFRPLEVVLCLVVLLLWRDALVVVAVHGLVWCLEAAYGLVMIRFRLFPLRLDRNFADLSRIFLQGFPLGLVMLLMVLPYQGPLIFFRHVAWAGDSLGQLALAMQAFFLLSYVPLAIAGVALPVLSRSAAREDGKDRLFAETALRFSLLLGAILALVGTALAPWLTLQIFGARYAHAGVLIGPSLWLMIPWATGQALIGVLMAGKRDLQVMFGALAGALFFSVTISEAVLRYDAAGAIGCAGAAMSVTTLCTAFLSRKSLALDLRSSLMKPALAVGSAASVFYILHFAGPLISLFGAVVTLAILCYLLSCLSVQDLMWLRQAMRWVAKKMSIIK